MIDIMSLVLMTPYALNMEVFLIKFSVMLISVCLYVKFCLTFSLLLLSNKVIYSYNTSK